MPRQYAPLIKRKGTRIPASQRHLISTHGRDPVQEHMNAIVRGDVKHTSNAMHPKDKIMVKNETTPEPEAVTKM